MERGGDRGRLLGLIDDGPMDHHARLVQGLLDCDAALVTLVDEPSDQQRFLGLTGLNGEAAARRGTPLDQSLCRDVATSRRALQLDDLSADPTYREHPALTDFGVRSYLGVPLAAPDGDVIGAVCAMNFEAHEWDSRDESLVGALRDVVQIELRPLLQAIRDRERTEEMSLLLSTLRHEMGSELTVVLGGIETAMLPRVQDDLRQQVLGNARRDCQRVIATLDALLRRDRRAPFRFQEVDLPALLADVLATSAVRDAGRVEVDVPPLALSTEPVLLGHVLRNLLENASKYSDGAIHVSTQPRDDARVGISVRDHGPGIPDEVVAQLFEPFSRPRGGGEASGFGLGLYIIRTLCERLGADLAVDTGDDGTTVTVVVAATQSPNPSKAASSSDGA